jgi:hypothetical protein
MNPQDPEFTKSLKFYSVGMPDWAENFIHFFGGIQLEKLSYDNINAVCSKKNSNKIFVYEDIFIEQNEYMFGLLKDGVIQQMIVYGVHPFKFSHELLAKIDKEHFVDSRLIFLLEGYFPTKYPNLKICHLSGKEHAISHHFNLLLSNVLKSRRKINKDFLMQVVPRDNFRKQIIEFLQNTNIFDNSIVNFEKSSNILNDKSHVFLQNIIKKYGDGHHISALNSFGNGLPNFAAYEKINCEIVVETNNISSSWNLSEKTFRPIALGIPIVFLGHKEMFDRLIQDGYKFYDNFFYTHWHSNQSLQERLPYLLEFLKHIKQDSMIKLKMAEIALYNQQWFWNHRKLQHYEILRSFFSNISQGGNMIENIYQTLNF